jgi:hypothetical protein
MTRYFVIMHLPLHSQERKNEPKMERYRQVEGFYEGWHPRIFDCNLVWKRMNEGAVERVHAPCLLHVHDVP